jgi:(S)-2-hydroxy-acid oxidase
VYDPDLSWDKAFAFIRQHTTLPIWIKGVYTPKDVSLAIDHSADGIIISNHGGRQLDGVPASLDALRECAPVAKGKISIGFDGGIRRGTDIFKALAMGADFCFAGRVAVWGLGVSINPG